MKEIIRIAVDGPFDFLLHQIVQPPLNFVDDSFNIRHRNRAFLACLNNAVHHFIAIKRLPASVLFNDHEQFDGEGSRKHFYRRTDYGAAEKTGRGCLCQI